jgi:hypothetical protein
VFVQGDEIRDNSVLSSPPPWFCELGDPFRA